MSPKVEGIELPNGEEVSNVQFVDDTTLLNELSEPNIQNLINKLDIFCMAYCSKIFIRKSIMVGWKKTIRPGMADLDSHGEAQPILLDISVYLCQYLPTLITCGHGSKTKLKRS